MTKKETSILESFIADFKDKEAARKNLRARIVRSLEKIENELYDDKDSTNEGLLTRVNNLDSAIKEIANMVRRTKVRNEVILGIIATIMMAVLSQLLNHYIKIF